MMQEIFNYRPMALLFVAAFAAGSLTAACYFYILYKSVIKTARSQKAAMTFIISYIIRIVLCSACFAAAAYFADIIGLIASTSGFFTTRAILLKYLSDNKDAQRWI
ncbi:N-ATPase subunit AtpR [Desulfobacterium sp. N47]|uniref:Uncharacterized protein n=1 Tax=uncultured Desulfobacterium sp. TaxID=201089 RepID=E1YLP0_9BACT|nr:unknown protein [uncultured Desulfobacterium sp.]